jgi:hypothetical protein
MSAMEGFAHPEFLIETEALEKRLGDPRLRIFDCTTNLIPDPKTTYQAVPGRADFEEGHIPGAQFIDLQADLSDQGHLLRFMLPSVEAFAAAMSRLGIGEGTRVVLSTAPPIRGGRPASGGCCASSASTPPRCSTAVGRNGVVREGRPKPAQPSRAHLEISSSASSDR